LKAIAVATGYTNSAIASATYTISATKVATPTFSPVAGTYTGTQNVTISCATSGVTIYYTTNGGTPSTSSSVYSGAISVTSTKTVKALAVKSGLTNSAVASATYTINTPTAATPTFSPAAGTYTSAQSVTISDTTAGAQLRYTTDGSTPSATSTLYSGAISVAATTTIKAIAISTGYTNSAVATAAYTINTPTAAAPTFSPAAGTYTSAQSVTISDTTSGATIYYTTNGDTPTASSTKYASAISVAATTTIKAIAIATGYTNSAVATAAYTIGTGTNILPNASFETASGSLPASWQQDGWGTGITSTYTYNTALGHTGTHSVTVKVTKYGTEGDAKWDLVNPITVTPGDTYVYTDWYQSDTTSRIVLEFNLSDGNQYYSELRNAPASPGVWKQYSQDLVIPYNAVSVRTYHMLSGVGSVTIDDVALVKTPAPAGFTRPVVTITFDDGFEDNITTAMPLLDEFGYKVTYCFATMYDEGIASAETTVKAIAGKGHEICSHSVNHLDQTTLTAAQLDYEFGHSQTYLQQLTGQPIHNYVSPYGTYNDFSIQYEKKYYRALRSTDEGYNSKANFDQYRIMVQNMTSTTTLAQYKSWVDQAIKNNSWLVIVYHRVATSDLEEFDTPAADFRPQLQYLKDKGVTVETLDRALSELEPQVGINDGYTAAP
jgi:peptidoglycan/xylan/chitin deacetylase (PgdA/CDA1 family)